jgi:hypothetical protein
VGKPHEKPDDAQEQQADYTIVPTSPAFDDDNFSFETN